ncbi:hypothetical protein RN001_013254 [Aquatica leii]|uniref:Tr-type G domain-containing protein n=1 Tax=Aquatica leii TaxID=1421715 RepID=A0AAN7NZW0_9COLE|nr:hypothetical protein RN001_013254 [Aquatica leii]
MEALKLQRSQLKSRLTRFKTFFGKISETNPVKLDDIIELSNRFQSIKTINQEYEALHFQIIQLDNDDSHDIEQESFENAYFQLTSKASYFINQHSVPDPIARADGNKPIKPDSWETQADSTSVNNSPIQPTDVTAKFSTFNVNVEVFVPSFARSAVITDESSPTKSPTSENSPTHKSLLNGTNIDDPTEREEVKEPPSLLPADGDASPGDSGTEGGTWEDEAEEPDALTPEGDEEEPSSKEAPKITKKKAIKSEEVAKNKKEHVNVVFIGHVDAGKSTIGGQIMALAGMVHKRTLEKYEREAREKSRESWYLSWALDTNQEERNKGKTVKVGRAYLETDKKHFTT